MQNYLLLLASYIFYCFADWKFFILLFISSLVSYLIGQQIQNATTESGKKKLLRLGVFSILGVLVYFKYTNFFIESFSTLLRACGLQSNIHTLNIVLPLAISFYTFRIISYLLDIYYTKIHAAQNIVSYLGYVAFFPELLSGPIDRARNLMPQIENLRKFDKDLAIDGLRQILAGLCKKILIADSCTPMVNALYSDYAHLPGSTLLLGSFFYAFQLYADFSGYSDMAIGIGKLMGFRLTRNFAYPFFAKNISDYWKKWHISLTTWLTDYVFIPLSIHFRNWGKLGIIISVIITFLIVGAWHEAKWTWIIYGLINGLLFIPLILKGNVLKGGGVIAKGKLLPSLKESFAMMFTFLIANLLFIINRSENIQQAYYFFRKIFSTSIFKMPSGLEVSKKTVIYILLLVIAEWLQREKQHFLDISTIKPAPVRFAIYYILIFLIIRYGGGQQQFIYFQF